MWKVLPLLSCLSVLPAVAADYHDLSTLVGPCAQDVAALAKSGDLEAALEKARSQCLAQPDSTCPDLWLAYAFCAAKLETEDAVSAGAAAVRQMPESAAAHLTHARAILQTAGSGGLMSSLRGVRSGRDALETALRLDPDCNPARLVLVTIYSLPKLAGGDAEKLKLHLGELEKRDPFYGNLANGQVALRQRDYSAARDAYTKAHELAPQKPEPVKGMIEAASRSGDFPTAYADLERLRPALAEGGVADSLFLELSINSATHRNEAIDAGARYLATAKGSALSRARVEVNLAVLLQSTGQPEAAKKMVASAEARWSGATDLYREVDKRYRKAMESSKKE